MKNILYLLCCYVIISSRLFASEEKMEDVFCASIILEGVKIDNLKPLEEFIKGKSIEEIRSIRHLWSTEDIKKLYQKLPEYDFYNTDFSSPLSILLKMFAAFEYEGTEFLYGMYLLNQHHPEKELEACYWVCRAAIKGDHWACCQVYGYGSLYELIRFWQEQESFTEKDIWQCADMMLQHLDKRLLTSEGKDTNPPEA